MYLVDTNVISEARKGRKANPGVNRFFKDAAAGGTPLFISVITVGEIRRGIELLRHRDDLSQMKRLETWLEKLLADFGEQMLEFGREEAQIWGRLCVPHPENAIDKQIAAIALTRDLTLVTRNTSHFSRLGSSILNPFDPA
ncbi:MAG: type II toxin-antitoxin system VapC family toxin [Pseudomonadota bacterium]|nr:type II toxin-antitoxin system VapC family toxin [Pseudomonadota bacterium]